MDKDERPYVKVAAEKLTPGMRLWDHDGGPYAVFVRREQEWRGTQHLGTRHRRIVFLGAADGREVSLAVDNWKVPVKVLREDVLAA